MTARSVLLALIVLLAVLFPITYAIFQDFLLAVSALGLAVIWLILEANDQQRRSSLFFVIFVALAVWGSLNDLPTPIMLIGLCCDLAAWDLSRFRTRGANSADHDPILEAAHLQKLAATTGAGFTIALISTLIRLPIHLNFVIFCLIVLLAIIVLRNSVLSLRR